MKYTAFIIFIAIFLVIYSFANYYFINRIGQALPLGLLSQFIKIMAIAGAVSFFIGNFLSFKYSNTSIDIIYRFGTYWMVYILYGLIFMLFFDIFRAINHFYPIYPNFITSNYAIVKQCLFYGATTIITIIVIVGTYNMYHITTVHIEPIVHKKVCDTRTLKVAFISDIHIGAIFGKSFTENIVNTINAANPDIVLIGGDIIDNNVLPVIKKDALAPFKNIKAKYGTYACMGNHDYMGDGEQAAAVINAHNIKLLRDEMECIEGKFYVVGLEDRMKDRTGTKRKALNNVIASADKSKPIIVMEHEPHNKIVVENNGVDLLLSGHTHNGQLWPFGWITGKVYELSWGYLQKGNTHYYTSCGIGTWGPAIKTSCTSELVIIDLKFD